jgi:hypothetical protein
VASDEARPGTARRKVLALATLRTRAGIEPGTAQTPPNLLLHCFTAFFILVSLQTLFHGVFHANLA